MRRDTHRLILYVFIISSVLTLFTSNDIVILTLTPIIFAICVHARIHNGKLLLLSQFVAANTLSMGLLIGSPTNIIIGEAFQINFIEYVAIMFVPAVFAFIFTFVAIDRINRLASPAAASPTAASWNWVFTERYRVPARAPWSEFTRSMRRWIFVFALAVLTLAVVTHFNASLYWASATTVLLASLLQITESVTEESYHGLSSVQRVTAVAETLLNVPYGIIFFGLAYFSFAEFLASSPTLVHLARDILLFVQENELLGGPLLVYLSGITTNVLNDLPAAALFAEVFQPEVTGVAADSQTNTILLQGLLVGLNIGCYLTPVGALAGLLWFNQMKKEARRQNGVAAAAGEASDGDGRLSIRLPTRLDLVRYGIIIFASVATLLGLFIPLWAMLIDLLVVPTTAIADGNIPVLRDVNVAAVLGGLLVILYLWLKVVKINSENQVTMSHMSEIFTIVNRIAIWSFKHRVLYIVVLLLLFSLISGSIIYWAESASVARYGSLAGDLRGVSGTGSAAYVLWFTTFLGSGFEQLHFPQSLLGQLMAGLVPLSAIAAVLHIARSTSSENLAALRRALGLGQIPNYRILVVNHQAKFEPCVRRMLQKRHAFVVLLCAPRDFARAEAFADELLTEASFANRVLVVALDADPYATLKNLDFASAGEIYFLSDLRGETDVGNMKMLTRIDAWLNAKRVAAADDLEQAIRSAPGADWCTVSHGDFVGIPKMFFEASSDRQLSRVRSTLSELTNYQTFCTSFDTVAVDQIFSDVFGDQEYSNRRFRFGTNTAPVSAAPLFDGGSHPVQQYKLVEHPVDAGLKKTLCEIFHEHFAQERARGRSAKIHSVDARIDLYETLAGLQMSKGVNVNPDSTLIGVVADLPGRRLPLISANAVVSTQSVTTSGVLELRRTSGRTEPPPAAADTQLPRPAGKQTIYLFNFNQYADTFLRTLIQSGYVDQVRAVIIVDAGVSIPDDIARSGVVTVVRRATIDDAISMLIPFLPGTNSPAPESLTRTDLPGLTRGDSVIVFTDYEHEVRSNIEMIQFIEGLDYRLSRADITGHGVQQKNIFLLVECSNNEMRFLFEHLSVDKILDISRLRVSYLEHFAELFHGFSYRMKDRSFSGFMSESRWGQFHSTTFNFRRSLVYAEYFKPFIVRQAEGYGVLNSEGVEMSVVGLKLGEVETLLAKYSEPPLVLVTICRLRPIRYDYDSVGEFGCGPQMALLDLNKHYVIQRHDCLVMMPLV
ncbi:MAG TPA: anion permease [Sphingomicrobium sp.]